MELKGFCRAKETISEMKRQLTEREKIFANYISDKGLVSKIYKELIQLSSKKKKKKKHNNGKGHLDLILMKVSMGYL